MVQVSVPCNLCKGDSPTLICVDNKFRICRCRHCSLVYVTPQPLFEQNQDVQFHETADAPADPAFRRDKERIFSGGLAELSERTSRKGRILDVGCGFGLFLDVARRDGWEPYGIDVSDVAISYARSTLGLANVERSDLSSAAFPDAHFNAVTLWNVLEHVPDPMTTMREVRRVLASDGTALVRVPNMLVHNALWRVRPLLRPLLNRFHKELPPYLGGISPPQHLYGFTPRTLTALLLQAGFGNVSLLPAPPHNSETALSRVANAVAKTAYTASASRAVLSPAIIALADAS